jgi:hypothetical protein
MKGSRLYIFTLFLFGILAFSSAEATSNTLPASSKSYTITKICATKPEKPFTGNSPFIRFHNGIDENSVSISIPSESIIPFKPVNDTPEKFAGIMEYISSLSFRLPVTREIFYATPLRSPPIFN